MNNERDDFSATVVQELGRRVNFICSNPGCEAPTYGPHSNPNKSVKIGKAAHISAAAGKGPRYDPSMTPEQRSAIDNGIYLCSNCHELVDKDEGRFTVEHLRSWKIKAEAKALDNLVTPRNRQKHQTSEGPTVVSINQTGGQTAHTIINGQIQRTLVGRKIPEPLLTLMRARKIDHVVIVLSSPDGEMYRFADELNSVLATIGLNDGRTRPAILWGPPLLSGGMHVESSATDPQDPLLAFATWLYREGFYVGYSQNEKSNRILIGFPNNDGSGLI